ncbi:hypothetical protein CHCC14816_2084 [Bacillus licheniformis]|nr:hypothetical protein CHCC14816_2084 [Bacillus licheniformis]
MYFNGSSLPFRVPLYILLIFRFERKHFIEVSRGPLSKNVLGSF